MTHIPDGKHTLIGSCHCKAVQFKASNVDFAARAKCNCSYCQGQNRIGIALGNDDLKLRMPDGSEQPFNFRIASDMDLTQTNIATYVPGIRSDGGRVNIHRCRNCGQDLFMTESIPAMGVNHINVNLTSLDLTGTGVTLKDLTDPKHMTYVDGKTDTWESRKAEPYGEGSW